MQIAQIFCQGAQQALFTQVNLQNMFSSDFYGFTVDISEFLLFFISLVQMRLVRWFWIWCILFCSSSII